MRLYRRGDQGEPVRDIQDRLARLGLPTTGDDRGIFGSATAQAVAAFQEHRGLPADGIVGPDTWRMLVRAGYRLGDRLLYLRIPMMRGDDVAELQRRLNAIGFESGKADGIFGAETLRALLEFQTNRGMAEDGIAGPAVLAELELIARATSKPGRDAVRERQWLYELPPTLAGQRIYIDPFCRTPTEAESTWRAALTLDLILQDLGATPIRSRSADTAPPERVRAHRANRLGADFVIAFAEPEGENPAVWFFATDRSRSAAGETIATCIARCAELPTNGRAIPILRDTRRPAVVVVTSPMDEQIGGKAAQGLIDLFAMAREERRLHGITVDSASA